MSGPFKLNYKNSAFPFRTSEDDITKLEKSLKTKKQKKTTQPIVSASGTFTKKRSYVGGFAGVYKPTKFGGITLGVQGGGSTSKKHDYPGEGYKLGPSLGVKIKLGTKK